MEKKKERSRWGPESIMISAIEKLICLGIADWQPKQPQLLASGSREGGLQLVGFGSRELQSSTLLHLLGPKTHLLATASGQTLSACNCSEAIPICFYLLLDQFRGPWNCFYLLLSALRPALL